MKRTTSRQVIALLLLTTWLAGCVVKTNGWIQPVGNLNELVANDSPPEAIRVATADGKIHVLRNPRVSKDSLNGYVPAGTEDYFGPLTIPVAQITGFEVQGQVPDSGATATGMAVGLVVIVGAAILLENAFSDWADSLCFVYCE